MSTTRESGVRKDYHVKLYKTPKEAVVAMGVVAAKKAEMRLDVVIVLGLLSGLWVGLGGLASIMAAGGMPNSDPGVKKIVAGVTFSVGLMLVVGAGSELFTGNMMYFTAGLLQRTVSPLAALRNWVVVWLANLGGCLATAYLLGYLTDAVASAPWLGYLQTLTASKIHVGWGTQVLRAVGCNILVCMAVLVSLASEDMGGKIAAIVFIISAFVIVGFEHVVANFFTLPLGLMYGAPSDIGSMVWFNLVPVTIGNMVGGAFVGFAYWWSYVACTTQPAKRAHSLWRRLLFGEGGSGESADIVMLPVNVPVTQKLA